MSKKFAAYSIQVFLLFFSFYGHGQIIEDNSNFSLFTVEYLGHKKHLSINEIVNQPEKYRFYEHISDIKKRTSSNDFWMRIRLKRNDAHPNKYLLEIGYPPLKYLTFYKVNGTQVTQKLRSGFNLPIEVRNERFRNHIFPIEIQDTVSHTYYLHVQTLGNMRVPISLHNADDFQKSDTLQTLELGIGIGLLFLVSIAASILFLFIRKSVYLLYSLYIFFVVLFIFSSSGLGFFYFWPQTPEWNLLINRTGLYGIVIFAALFTLYFLRVSLFSKTLSVLLVIDAVLHVLFLAVLFLGVEVSVLPRVTFSTALHSILLIIVGIVAITKNKNQAILYTSGVILFWVMTVIHLLGMYEFLPYVPNLLLLRIAWYVEVLFLTIAVIYSFRQVIVENKLLVEKHKLTETQLTETKDSLTEVKQEIEKRNRKLLTSNIEATKQFEDLVSIKNETTNQKVLKKLEQLIVGQHSNNITSSWEEFKLLFEQIYPSFVEKISKEYPQLSQNDLRYAAYVKMGLSSKEIALMMNINASSLKNTRYRIRKKIDLDSSIKVNDFFLSF